MKVTNLKGTGDNICKCGGWLKHWVKFNNGDDVYCSEELCGKRSEVGAHVQKADSDDDNWYIIPLCKKHNETGDTLTIVGEEYLVSANVSETCGKAEEEATS